jgi:hypothetical protein
MKKILTFCLILSSFMARAQTLCPGGGTEFANAVLFQDMWINGCLTGTSCNGATNFNNMTACEPTAAIDPCAPSPTGVTLSECGSDLWFEFIPGDTTAFISVIKNVSFMASIQAFSSSTGLCSGLTDIGIVHSSNPSGPIGLTLNGLTIGNSYYFRVFGAAKPASQRTGLYCFCGSTGLTTSTLPIDLIYFGLQISSETTIALKWKSENAVNFSHFELERRVEGGATDVFETLSYIKLNDDNTKEYNYTDRFEKLPSGVEYRLKMVDFNGSFTYSKIETAFSSKLENLKILNLTQYQVLVSAQNRSTLNLYSIDGKLAETVDVVKGINTININLDKGVYIAKSDNQTFKRLVVE